MSAYSLACNNANVAYFSDYAKEFVVDEMMKILNLGEKEIITWIQECLSHDGYDNEGPESNLYDLYVISYNSALHMYTYHTFHAEQWFTPNEVVQYSHVSSVNSTKYYPIFNQFDLHEVLSGQK